MRRQRHEKIVLTCAAILLFGATTAFRAVGADGPTLHRAPLSPDFETRASSAMGSMLTQLPLGRGMGLIPRLVDLSHTKGRLAFRNMELVGLPASYDLRLLGKLTPVGDQGACGSCWAFATYGSLESWLMPGENWDFSENNLINLHGFDRGPCEGGNDLMSIAYLARWSGPIDESDDPYNFRPSPIGLPVRKHVQEAVFIPDRDSSLDNNNIKLAVMAYGAIYTTMYYGDTYYNSTTAAYYFSGYAPLNHAVCIVGWNDGYSRNNFATRPPGDGAFIVRNSWGPFFGDAGYFYVSYYDSNIGRDNTGFEDAQPTTNYGGIFEYDPFGWVTSVGYPGYTTAWGANVYRTDTQARIAAVSFYAASPDSPYEIQVHTNPVIGPLSNGGPVLTQGGTASFGYQTVVLDSPVEVSAGQKFSVILEITTPDYEFPIAAEDRVYGYTSHASANPGESFVSFDGSYWEDVTSYWPNMNVCLKAFTSPYQKAATPSFSPDAGTYYEAIDVAISCSTPGAVIRYTTNGGDPSETSPLYGSPIRVDHDLTLKARAWKSGLTPSNIKSARYTIILHTPTDTSLSPDSGWLFPEQRMAFTSTYSDAAGYADLARCYLLINNTLSTAKAVHLKYDFDENKLYVRNDGDTAWLGGYAPGSSRTIENSYCRLYCAYTSLAAAGDRLAVNWSLLIKSKLPGNTCKAWMKVFDKENQRAGWDQMGEFSIARPPKNESISPNSGTFYYGREYSFTSKYSDPNGNADIAQCYLLISPNTSDPKMLYVKYDAQSNKLYLWNTGSKAWIGGYSPGANTAIENAYSKIHCEGVSVTTSGTAMYVRWRIEFKKPMSGKTCGQWMTVCDKERLSIGPDKKGGISAK